MLWPRSNATVEDLEHRRLAIRRGLARANTAAVATLLVLVLFALGAVLLAYRVERERERVVQAQTESASESWQKNLERARRIRMTGEAESKARALEAVAAGAAQRPSLELRNEAIANLIRSGLVSRHENPVTNVLSFGSFDADARHIPLHIKGKGVVIYDVINGSETSVIPDGGQVIFGLKLSPSREWLALQFWDTGEVWHLPSREKRSAFPMATAITAHSVMDFDRPGKLLAYRDKLNSVRILELAGGTTQAQWHGANDPVALRFHPDGQSLALGAGLEVIWWSCQDDRTLGKIPIAGSIQMDWRADGLALAVGCSDQTLRVWDIASGRVGVLRGHQAEVVNVHFLGSSPWLGSYSWDGTSKLWDSQSGECAGSSDSGRLLGFNREGNRAGFIVGFRLVGNAEIDLPAGYRRLNDAAFPDVRKGSVSVSSDGRWLLGRASDGLRIWDTREKHLAVFRPDPSVRCAQFLPGEQAILVANSDGLQRIPLVVETNAAGAQLTFGTPTSLISGEEIGRAQFTVRADGRVVFIQDQWDSGFSFPIDQPSQRQVFRGQYGMNQADLSPDGRWLATGTFHGKFVGAWVWDAGTGKVIKKLGTGDAWVAWSPDSRWLLRGTSDFFELWETSTWTVRWTIPRSNAGELRGTAAFSPDGRTLAVQQSYLGIKLLDLDGARELASLIAPSPAQIGQLCFSPDGEQLAATSSSGMDLWNLRELREKLAVWRLDWNESGEQPESIEPIPPTPGAWGQSTEARWYLGCAIAGVLTALVLAAFVFNRHRNLLESYEQIDAMAAARGRELTAVQLELARGEKMRALGTLSAGIAHDFNNLLSVVRLSNDFVRRGINEHPELREEVESIETAVQQGKDVVRSMLSFSRLQADDLGPWSLADVVGDTVALLRKQFLSGLTLELDIDRAAPRVRTSRSRLEQTLLNLLVNAAEAMGGHGRLGLTVRRPGGIEDAIIFLRPSESSEFVELTVTDSGPGIAPEVLPRIFDPFFTTKHINATPGTGLGLATVYANAEAQGMGIAVETRVGSGTAFRIMIPCEKPL